MRLHLYTGILLTRSFLVLLRSQTSLFLCCPFFLIQVMIPVGVGPEGREEDGETPRAVAHMPFGEGEGRLALWTNKGVVHDEE